MKMRHTAIKLSFVFLVLAWTVQRALAAEDQRRTVIGNPPPSIPRVNTPYVQPPIPKPVDTSVIETQRQLQNILQVQKTLELQHQREILEITRIVEQARAHQQLLRELSAEEAGGEAEKEKEFDKAVRRQKIKLIEKQTEENRAIVEEIKTKTAEELQAGQALEETPPPEESSAASEQKPAEETKKDLWWWLRNR